MLAYSFHITTSVFYIYYLNSYFSGIPHNIYQAAKINGASNWEYIWKILVSMAKPHLKLLDF